MLRVYLAGVSRVPESPIGLPLSEYRLEKLTRLRPPLARRQGIGAELLLIRALRDTYDSVTLPLSIKTGECGKPYLTDYDCSFSLSHSGDRVGCVLWSGPVGLDLEMQTALREPVLRRCFTPAEQRFVAASPEPDDSFCRLFVGKESYAKALGTGLRTPLSSIDMLRLPESVFFYYTRLGELHLSLCVPGGDPGEIRIEEVDLA